jgi:hypothetical protein
MDWCVIEMVIINMRLADHGHAIDARDQILLAHDELFAFGSRNHPPVP